MRSWNGMVHHAPFALGPHTTHTWPDPEKASTSQTEKSFRWSVHPATILPSGEGWAKSGRHALDPITVEEGNGTVLDTSALEMISRMFDGAVVARGIVSYSHASRSHLHS